VSRPSRIVGPMRNNGGMYSGRPIVGQVSQQLAAPRVSSFLQALPAEFVGSRPCRKLNVLVPVLCRSDRQGRSSVIWGFGLESATIPLLEPAHYRLCRQGRSSCVVAASWTPHDKEIAPARRPLSRPRPGHTRITIARQDMPSQRSLGGRAVQRRVAGFINSGDVN
jgi:hypothetical protein